MEAGSGARQWRRGGAPGGAAPLRTGAERLASVPGGPIARLAQRGPRKPPGASRRSIPSRSEGRKKGKDAPASIKIGPAELWLKRAPLQSNPIKL